MERLLAVRKKEEGKLHTTEMSICCSRQVRKDKTKSCEKCRHLERGTHVRASINDGLSRIRWTKGPIRDFAV